MPLPSPGSQGSVASTNWLTPTLGTPRAGVCHSLAAPAFAADGHTQPQVSESHSHSDSQGDKCQAGSSGIRPSDPVWTGDLSVKT